MAACFFVFGVLYFFWLNVCVCCFNHVPATFLVIEGPIQWSTASIRSMDAVYIFWKNWLWDDWMIRGVLTGRCSGMSKQWNFETKESHHLGWWSIVCLAKDYPIWICRMLPKQLNHYIRWSTWASIWVLIVESFFCKKFQKDGVQTVRLGEVLIYQFTIQIHVFDDTFWPQLNQRNNWEAFATFAKRRANVGLLRNGLVGFSRAWLYLW